MEMFIRCGIAFFFSLFLPSFCLDPPGLKSPENYGPYVMDWESYSLCKGPKAVNLTHVTYDFHKDDLSCVFNLTFFGEARIDEVKVSVMNKNDGEKKILWNYRMKDPCRHFMVASLIKPYLNTENCVVKKGFYSCHLNFHETSKIFFGPSFFYGKFSFKTTVTSKAGNIHCFESTITFSKRS